METFRAVTTEGPGAHGAPIPPSRYSCGVAPPGHITLVYPWDILSMNSKTNYWPMEASWALIGLHDAHEGP